MFFFPLYEIFSSLWIKFCKLYAVCFLLNCTHHVKASEIFFERKIFVQELLQLFYWSFKCLLYVINKKKKNIYGSLVWRKLEFKRKYDNLNYILQNLMQRKENIPFKWIQNKIKAFFKPEEKILACYKMNYKIKSK